MVKEVQKHKFLVCTCNSQNFAQNQKYFALSHNRETVTFRNSVMQPGDPLHQWLYQGGIKIISKAQLTKNNRFGMISFLKYLEENNELDIIYAVCTKVPVKLFIW